MAQIDGRWTIEADSPMGKQVFTADLATADGTAKGTLTGPDGTPEPIEGKVDGSTLSFQMEITTPMKLKLTFTLTFDGDAVTGKIKPGMFPAAKVTGFRVA
jgi:hypothetical protein